jgi:chromosome transmission fidelity protein 4
VGSTWAAVVTNLDLLRIFTIGGLQTALVSLPGPIVCMSGHGSQLIVVYHNGMGLPGSQCLAVKLIDLDTSTQVIADQRLPLSPKANLSWLG